MVKSPPETRGVVDCRFGHAKQSWIEFTVTVAVLAQMAVAFVLGTHLSHGTSTRVLSEWEMQHHNSEHAGSKITRAAQDLAAPTLPKRWTNTQRQAVEQVNA